jgi:hypothetical protein
LDVFRFQQGTFLPGAFSFPFPSPAGVAQFVPTPADLGGVGVGFALGNPKIKTLRGRPAKDCVWGGVEGEGKKWLLAGKKWL